VTIEIPDDLASDLAGIAAARNMSVEQLAVARLRGLLARSSSPAALLAALRALPHPSAAAVDDLEAAIAEGRLPVQDAGVFDR
jgi:hypothetical protein